MMPVPTRIARTFRWLTSLTAWAIFTTVSSVQAAERVEFGFGSFEYGISLKELAAYGAPEQMGKAKAAKPVPTSRQRGYSIDAKDRQYLQQILRRRWDFKPRQVSQFFHSAVGEKILV